MKIATHKPIVKKYKIFIFLTIAYLAIYYLYYAKVFDYALANKMTPGVQDDYIRSITKSGKYIGWILVVLTVCFIYVRVFFVSLFLLTGTYLSNTIKITFNNILRIVLAAEFVFLFRDALVIGAALMSDNPDSPVFDASFSLGFLFNQALIEYPYLAYPLKSFSLYLVTYVIVLTLLIKKDTTGFGNSLKFICSYFGLGFFIWIALVVSFNLYAAN